MAAPLGTLTVQIAADVAKLTTGFDAAKKQVDGFVGGLKNLAVTFAAVTAAAATSHAIFAQFEKADAIEETAQALGIATERLEEWQFAASLSGVAAEEFQVALRKLNNVIDDALGGGDDATEAFRRLGVSITDANGQLKPTDQLLNEISDAFAGMEDGAKKSALATDLFGRSGAKMIPVLNKSAEGIKALADEFHALGGGTSAQFRAASDAISDNLDKLAVASESLAKGLAVRLAPAILELTNTMVEAAKDSGGFKVALDATAATINFMLSGIAGLGSLIVSTFKNVTGALAIATLWSRAFWDAITGKTVDMEKFDAAVEQIRSNMVDIGVALRDAIAIAQRVQQGAPVPEAQPKAGRETSDKDNKKALAAAEARAKALEKEAEAFKKLGDPALEYAEQLQRIDVLSKTFDAQGQALLSTDERLNAINATLRKQFSDVFALADAWEKVNNPIKEVNRQIERVNAALEAGAIDQATAGKAIAQIWTDARQPLEDMIKALEQAADPMDQFAQAIEAARRAFLNGIIPMEEYERQLKRIQEAQEKFKAREAAKENAEAIKEIVRAVEGYAQRISDTIIDFASGASVSFKEMVASILRDLAKLVFYTQVIKPIFKELQDSMDPTKKTPSGTGSDSTGGLGGIFGGIFGSILKGIFGGAMAEGGRVVPNRAFLVGERGPELFVPDAPGQIVPNGGGTGGTFNLNFQTPGASEQQNRQLARRIETAVRDILVKESRPGGILGAS